MRFRYFDPSQQSTVDGEVTSHADLSELVGHVASLRGGAGAPALELSRHDGSSLVLGLSGDRAVLLWTDPSGETAHSVGATGGDSLVFDYFGAYTELPASYAVRSAEAIDAAAGYLDGGRPRAALVAEPRP